MVLCAGVLLFFREGGSVRGVACAWDGMGSSDETRTSNTVKRCIYRMDACGCVPVLCGALPSVDLTFEDEEETKHGSLMVDLARHSTARGSGGVTVLLQKTALHRLRVI